MAIDQTGQEVPILDTSTGAPQSSGSATSLFNAFYVFKYSGGVDKINAQTYASNNRADRNGAPANVISNPTAAAIVQWAQSIPVNSQTNPYTIKNSPYSWADFLFCKWYGVVPNNRLVTLRKFPIGSSDDAGVRRVDPAQNIPVAQAVTWFGGPTSNSINEIWQNSWSLAWTKKETTAKDVQGNEFVNFSTSLVKALPEGINPFVKTILSNLADQVDLANSSTGVKSVGKATIAKAEQDFIKGLWSDNGAFFNQIQGPVNVKNQFLIRDRGLSNTAPDAQWNLIFEYRTDSYFGMSQRRVALDIIANMLALTYSDGEWLESLNVYYKKLGLELAPAQQKMIEACFKDGVFDPEQLMKVFLDIAKASVGSIVEKGIQLAASSANAAGVLSVEGLKDLLGGDTGFTKMADAYKNLNATDKATLEGAIEIQLTKALADSFPAFIQQRANVANIPTGNWHLTIGNPMNPIMRIGDIVVRSCKVEFGEELGADDFPIDLKFTVTLSPTKPRNGADIRRTFNNGRIDYIETSGGATYDQLNTYGISNKALTEASVGALTPAARALAEKASNASQARVTSWLDSRYGAGMVNAEYLRKVYFYRPKEETVGGTKNQP
jgi:hypothetical protein